MPYRILHMINGSSSLFTSIIDGTILTSLAVWKGSVMIMSDDTWAKVTGPHGLVFALIIGLVVVWTKSVRDDASRERRHKETLKLQKEHFEKLIDINAKTAEDLTVLTVASTKAQMSATNAIISMDHNIVRLTNELADTVSLKPRRKAMRVPTTSTEEIKDEHKDLS
jgi:hypothetical protein